MTGIGQVRLRLFFSLRTSAPGGVPYRPGRERYIPRGNGRGHGWGVWDQEAERFLSDEEVASLGNDLINAIRKAN